MEKIRYKECKICSKKIDTKKDNYAKVIDYLKGEFYIEGFYHNKCYSDRINKAVNPKTEALQNMAASLLKRANSLLPVEDEQKVYQIK